MIKFIICDDNKTSLTIACRCINKVLMKYNIDYKIKRFTDYDRELKEEINNNKDIKVYILDIELPTKSGLEIASEIREIDDESIIVFETIHPECKDDIFYSRLEVLDFICKEYMYEERLEDTIKHILNKIYRNKSYSFTFNKIYNKILLKEINYIEKEQSKNKCIIHLTTGEEKYVIETIKNLKENVLPTFFQTHKACIINLDNIRNIDYDNNIIYFKNDEYTILLSNEFKKELRKYVENI